MSNEAKASGKSNTPTLWLNLPLVPGSNHNKASDDALYRYSGLIAYCTTEMFIAHVHWYAEDVDADHLLR